jgi:hypothetical protein
MASGSGKLGPNAASGAHSGLKSWQVRLEVNEIKFCAVLDRSSRNAVSRKCDVATLMTVVQYDAERRQRKLFCGVRDDALARIGESGREGRAATSFDLETGTSRQHTSTCFPA